MRSGRAGEKRLVQSHAVGGAQLIKKVKNNVTKDYILLKLVHHYNEKVLSGSEEEQQYIKLFAALEAKGKFLSLVEQKRIEQKVKPKKN